MIETILIADDEENILRLVKLRLQNQFRILKAHDGREALDIARRERPHFIILDIMMPGMDGATVAMHLREDPLTSSIPILFLTALAEEENQSDIQMTPEGHMILGKPINLPKLLRAIQRGLQGSRSS